MKAIDSSTRFIAIATIACGIFSAACAVNAQSAGGKEQTFASPEDAIAALKEAAQAQDKAALDKIFGPGVKLLRTGDAVEDANHRAHFAHALAESCQQAAEGDGKIILEIGTNNWPFPIPLVKNGAEWRFDTEAGEEEIQNRHIGQDELNAIGVCNAYVKAQRQYNSLNPEQSSEPRFALKFKSSPGRKDGLYWPDGGSPFGPLVSEAYSEGYTHLKSNNGPHPFHGYCFRILTEQGRDAPGGRMNYMHHGHLSRGFALVAYPVVWDKAGVMTFIVNHDGRVYQRNLGEKTVEIASSMKEYSPDNNWTLVQDEGVLEK